MLANLRRKTLTTALKYCAFANAGLRHASSQGGHLSEKDLAQVQFNFQRSDKNIDHLLDPWEFNNFTKFTLGRRLNEVDLRQLFGILDLDKDGQVTIEEIVYHLEKRFKVPTKGNMEFAFCTYDKNEDQRLYLHEVRQALYFLGYPGGHKSLKKIFEKYDTNRDQQIFYKEFEAIVLNEMPALSNH